jgi:hypothetical protein
VTSCDSPKVFLEDGQYIEDDTTFLMSITSVTITSYSDSSANPKRALVIPTAIQQPGIKKSALFHILQHTDLWLSAAITKGTIKSF